MPASPLLTVMMAAVRKAARDIRRDYGEVSNLQVSQKAPGDYVTAADKRCEKILRVELEKARPGYGFLMEESGEVKGTDPENRFIVDPIDGTVNFMHAVPFFAISVALERRGEIFAGVTYNPVSDEMFVAEKGGGAYLNNRRLRVSGRKDLGEALVCCGIPHRGRAGHELARKEIAAMQQHVIGVRRLGSATLELAYLAAGRFDAVWERNLRPWDMAAGIALIREAGGFTSDCDGDQSPFATGNILAANSDLLPQMKKTLAEAR
jgi:myo-inositol-1(or 4)-monophosphatase